MDQTRVIQLLPWRCVLEMGNAKIQSPAYRQFFKETKTKRVRVILRKLGFFNDFWIFVGIFGCFEFLIRPTNIQSTQKVSVFGYVLCESRPASIRKSPPKG